MTQNCNIYAAAILLLLALASPAQAAEEDEQVWTTATASGVITGKLAGHAELQARFGDGVSRLSQTTGRFALGYRADSGTTFLVGFALITNHREGGEEIDEHRLWQQASYTLGDLGPVRLTGRTRLEQRLVEGANDLGWRLRQQLRASLKLNEGGLGLFAAGESLFALNDTDWGADTGLDQLRGTAGVSIPLGAKQSLEPGYLLVYARRPEAPDRIAHVAAISLSHRF